MRKLRNEGRHGSGVAASLTRQERRLRAIDRRLSQIFGLVRTNCETTARLKLMADNAKTAARIQYETTQSIAAMLEAAEGRNMKRHRRRKTRLRGPPR